MSETKGPPVDSLGNCEVCGVGPLELCPPCETYFTESTVANQGRVVKEGERFILYPSEKSVFDAVDWSQVTPKDPPLYRFLLTPLLRLATWVVVGVRRGIAALRGGDRS